MSMLDFIRFRAIHCAYKSERAAALVSRPTKLSQICIEAAETVRAGASALPESAEEDDADSDIGYDTCDCSANGGTIANPQPKRSANPVVKRPLDLPDDLPDLVSDDGSESDAVKSDEKEKNKRPSVTMQIPLKKRLTRAGKKR